MMTTPVLPATWQRKRQVDRQYAAAAHIFDFLPRAWAFCDEHGVRKAELLRASRTWSHGEQILVKVALDLFDPGCVKANRFQPAHLGEITSVLGGRFFRTFLEALRISRPADEDWPTGGWS